MKAIPLFLALLGFFNFTLALRHSNVVRLHNYTRNHKNKFSTTGTNLDGAQIAGYFDPEESATDEAWTIYKDKGAWLGCLLDATDKGAGKAWPNYLDRNPPSAKSEWQGTLQTELRTWGWRENEWEKLGDVDQCDFGTGSVGHGTVKSAFDALGLNVLPKHQGGDNECFAVEHYDDEKMEESFRDGEFYKEYYWVNGQQYRLTGASYGFGVNQKGGALIAKTLSSPHYAAVGAWEEEAQPIEENQLPALRRPSDIMAGYWLRDNLSPKSLEYYFAIDVQNEDTLPIMTSVLKKKGLKLMPKWPGVKVGMWEDEGEVLLGSPMGTTIAFLLLQHKQALGTKHVTDITMFREDDDGEEEDLSVEVHLLFEIKDVPNAAGEKEDENVEMPDVDDKPGVRREIGSRAATGVVKREYFASKGVRVHEFRVG